MAKLLHGLFTEVDYAGFDIVYLCLIHDPYN